MKARAHGSVVRALHESAKLIEKGVAQLCVLADYVKLVKALCADHSINLLTVPSAKTLGEWAGLCKIDSEGNARKVVGRSKFSRREDSLLHSTCGTPNYVAPEVINNKGYDGAKADLWSCGVILFVLMAGYLPFEDSNLASLYKKIFKAEFTCPHWFSAKARASTGLSRSEVIFYNGQRITFAEVIENEWFNKGYKAPKYENANVSLDDVDAIFDESGESQKLVVERREEGLRTPVTRNAFELISTFKGLNLGSLFEKQMLVGEKSGRKGQLAVTTEVFQVAPSLYMVEMRKSGGDTLEFHKFYKNLTTGLKDIVWKTIDEVKEEGTQVSGGAVVAS
ncbi:CBL-interacting serine/threonine-protein kinase 23 isoform X2 [Brassica napus]|uniref:CBL-interacting serine/threonine-protein kinase 23 isoform X2 n=1 Tax=Brassica napus TaxID=3708 RepID=UPI000BBEBEB8|nr:CBL-interacting serine/threonine-protein kinase 23 isoform X2 [Brassica napus]